MKHPITLFSLAVSACLFLHLATAFAGGAEVTPVKAISSVANPDVRYLTTGPSGSGPLLRLSILLSEVYNSVVVEEIFEDPLKEGQPSIESAHLLTGAALGAPLGLSKLTQLRFVRWHSSSEAELTNGDLHFLLTRSARGVYSVRAITP